MFCVNCGKEMKGEYKFCTNCGTKVLPIESSKKEEKVEEVKKNVVVENTVNSKNTTVGNEYKKEDKTSIGLSIVSFFVPVVGLVLYLIMRKETPNKAKSIGICALIGYVLSIVISVIMCIYIFAIGIPQFTYKHGPYQYRYEYNERSPYTPKYNI